ncbi:SRPBCC family protein [Naasia sp. SYSU D00948]|uniref:SRPBCC family protein n=1 Tax=Naasia sp. SYSU D00948 TaxID=2817379 RepID=UPI001B304B09|nr:SRPBCC family protein [Naasia sp. SYSU D00948]
MSGFTLEEHIARPPKDVFDVLADPTRATVFLDNIKESRRLTDGPISVGTAFRETRVVNGREATADLVVSVYEPDTHIGISTEAEGIRVTYDYRLVPDGEGTRLTWTCQLETGRLRRLMLPVVSAILRKEDGDHLQKLKAYLEAR